MRLRNLILLALATSGLCLAQASRADTLSYLVTVNLGPLMAAPAGAPYAIDFQLNGDGLGLSNTVVVNNFSFTGGSAIPGTAQAFGSASGNLASGITLTENSTNFFNEFFQQFTATTTSLRFMVTATLNSSGITPDAFLFSILDNSLGQIITNSPDGVSLLVQSINGTAGLSSVSTYGSTSPAGVTVGVAAAPENGTTASLVFISVGGLLLLGRKWKTAQGSQTAATT